MKNQPKNAIEKGLTSQLTKSVTPMPRTWRRRSCRALKSTFTSIGTIITQMRRPTGKLTSATVQRESAANTSGSACPSPMPAPMHRSTQSVR